MIKNYFGGGEILGPRPTSLGPGTYKFRTEGEGFEPPKSLRTYWFSGPAHSTALASFQLASVYAITTWFLPCFLAFNRALSTLLKS